MVFLWFSYGFPWTIETFFSMELMERSFNIGLQWFCTVMASFFRWTFVYRWSISWENHPIMVVSVWYHGKHMYFVGKSSINGGHCSFPSILAIMDFQPSQIPVDKHNGSQKKCDLEGYTTYSDTPMCFPSSTNWLHNMYHSSALAIFCFHHLCPWFQMLSYRQQNVYTRDKLPDPNIISYQIKTNHAYHVSKISRVYHYDPQLCSLNPLVVNSPQINPCWFHIPCFPHHGWWLNISFKLPIKSDYSRLLYISLVSFKHRILSYLTYPTP